MYVIANEFSGRLELTFSSRSCCQIFKSSRSARDGDHSILAVQWPSAQAFSATWVIYFLPTLLTNAKNVPTVMMAFV